MKDVPTAFPWTHDDITCTGMALRDYFAAKAMQGLLASEVNAPLKTFAKQAYTMADAMMEVRNESQ